MKVDRRLVKHLKKHVEQLSGHWALVDAHLPPSLPLLVLSDVDRAGFLALWDSLLPLHDAVRERKLELRIAKGAFAMAKKAVFLRMKGLRQLMVGLWRQYSVMAALPLLPRLLAGRGEFTEAAWGMKYVWLLLGGLPQPVPGNASVLHDGFSAADFAAALEELWGLWDAVGLAKFEVRLARGFVEFAQVRLVAAVMAYGHSARGRLLPGEALAKSIPRTWRRRRKKAGAEEKDAEVVGMTQG